MVVLFVSEGESNLFASAEPRTPHRCFCIQLETRNTEIADSEDDALKESEREQNKGFVR